MGLDTTHDAWHGSYSAFGRWREMLAEVAEIPLDLMDGYWGHLAGGGGEDQWPRYLASIHGSGGGAGYLVKAYVEKVDRWLPIEWGSLKPDILHVLLDHSDCDGWIEWQDCGPLADRLAELLPLLPDEDAGGHIGDWRAKTQTFIDGLRAAAAAQENVEFH